MTWVRDNGQEADAGYLADNQNHFIAFRLDGTEVGDPSASIFVAYNGFSADIPATLPANLSGNRWYLVADTASPLEGQDERRVSPATAWQRDLHDRLPFSLDFRRATLSPSGPLFHRHPSSPTKPSAAPG